MDQHRSRIVVGEGQTLRRGLLRFVLEGEGYDVVAEAGSSAELARMVAVHEPDVVVLDDGIGATAVQMARELAPKAKVILVWPGAVVPIGGDARVEPAEVLKGLGAAVQKVTAHPAPITETLRRPAWIDRVRKDPATLRDLLEKSGGLPRRPSVTELQRRGQRLHPVGRPDDERSAADPPDAGSASPDETPSAPVPDDADRPTAPVVILPVPGAADTDEPILVLSGQEDAAPTDRGDLPPTSDATAATDLETAAATPAATPPEGGASGLEGEDAARRGAAVIALPTAATAAATTGAEPEDPAAAWNRRLGSIALGGAAVAGALVLALSLGGSRVPTEVLAAQPPIAGAQAPTPFEGDAGALDPGGSAGAVPEGPTLAAVPPTLDPAPDRSDVPPPVTQPPVATPPEEPPEEEPPIEPPIEPPSEPPSDGGLPGASDRNPHGGPPGLTGDAPDTPGGPPTDVGPGHGNGNGNGPGNGNGNGNGNGPPAEPPGQGGSAAHATSHVHKR